MSVLIKKQSYLLPVVWPVLVSYRLIRYQLWYGIYTAYIIFASLFAAIAVSIFLPGRQSVGQPANKPPFGSLAQITSISPDTSQVLHPGQQVRLKVDVSYVLTSASGTIKLLVLAADSSELGQDVKVIAKGNGKSTLETQFTAK